MTTEQLLDLRCETEANKKVMNRFLWKVKPVAKLLQKNGYTKEDIAPTELLEQALHGICIRYGFRDQGITTYYEGGKFKFYSCSIIRKEDTNTWKGNVYGSTLWEIVAKKIIKVYSEILKERSSEE